MERRVQPATKYKMANMGSRGNASSMFIRQFNFPDFYDDQLDVYEVRDHDRIMQSELEHANACFKKHTKQGELYFETWVLNAYDAKILIFLKEIMRADKEIKWTGYRIRGTVNVGNGFPVWTFELFAKHPDSKTIVYTGENAPNIKAHL